MKPEYENPSPYYSEPLLIDKILNDEILCFADFNRDENGKILKPYQINFVLNGGIEWTEI